MKEEQRREWGRIGTQLLRGTGGGLIIGIPLLYSTELWRIGMYLDDWQVILFLLVALIINFGLNHASGFSEKRDPVSDVRHAVTALGVSVIISALVLALISAIPQGYSLTGALGKIALGAIPVSIGFSVANTQFSRRARNSEEEESGKESDEEKRKARTDLLDVGITIAGAVIFVFAVAPTEEILLITARTTGYHWAGLVVFSVLITYGIVFAADFVGASERQPSGLLQKPVPETIIAYVFSVLTGMALLFLLGRGDVVYTSISNVIGHAAVIGLPAAVGGAAGRLIV